MDRHTRKKIRAYFRMFTLRYPGLLCLSMLGACAITLSRIATPLLTGAFFEYLVNRQQSSRVWITWWALVGSYVTLAAFSYLHATGSTLLMAKVTGDLRLKGFRSFLRAGRINLGIGDVVARLTDDTVDVQWILTALPVFLVVNILWVIGMVIALGKINTAFLYILLAFVPLYLVVGQIVAQRIRSVNRALMFQRGRLAEEISEGFETLPLTHSYALEEYWEVRFRLEIEAFKALRYKFARWQGAAQSVAHFISDALPAALLVAGTYQVLEGTMGLGLLIASYGFATQLFAPIEALTTLLVQLITNAPAVERVAELIEMEQQAESGVDLQIHTGTVEFRDVTFGYDGLPPILQHFSARFTRDALNIVVGPNGAGKSTIIGLIQKSISPQRGAIYVDDVDIATCCTKNVRAKIALVAQRTQLLNVSVLENVWLGNTNKERSCIPDVSDALGLTELIADLDGGWDYVTGRNGNRLSGGQAQRVSLARALFKDAPILILDEGTASMDSDAEDRTYRLLQGIVGRKTVIVIAHRIPKLDVPHHLISVAGRAGSDDEEVTHA